LIEKGGTKYIRKNLADGKFIEADTDTAVFDLKVR